MFETYAKVVVNAAGPFCDSVRKLADKEAPSMICPSSGVHIVLPDYYSPDGMGLIVPKTKDGRVVFMLPWLGRTIAGTTDSNTVITPLPEPHEDEIQFILDAISDYLSVKVCDFTNKLFYFACHWKYFLELINLVVPFANLYRARICPRWSNQLLYLLWVMLTSEAWAVLTTVAFALE